MRSLMERRHRMRYAKKRSILAAVIFFLCAASVIARADDKDFCQVVVLEGKAFLTNATIDRKPLKEGDLLAKGDLVEVPPGSEVDVAFDKAGKNIAHLETGSTTSLDSITPPVLSLKQGGIFAELKKLPRTTTFEVQTPTAIAAVRGTVYRTTFKEDRGTEVFNFSSSPVYVYAKDASGARSGQPLVLKESQKTEIAAKGEAPRPPSTMNDDERSVGEKIKSEIADHAGETAKKENPPASVEESPEAVLMELSRAYQNKDMAAFMSRVSDTFSYRGELEEFLRRDFHDYDGIQLNFFIGKVTDTPDGKTVQADWQLRVLPTALSTPIEVRGSGLQFIFVYEGGKLKMKAMRGANPLFGARSPEIAATSGVRSSVVSTLQNVEDFGTRQSRQAVIAVVGTQTNGNTVAPVNIQIISEKVYATGSQQEFAAQTPPGATNIEPELIVKLVDNPMNASLRNVTLQVTVTQSGGSTLVLTGRGDLLPGQNNTLRTSDSFTTAGTHTTGTMTFVIDPNREQPIVDRSNLTDTIDYSYL